MSFTAAQKLRLPRTHHACAEESQRHVPWIPTPSSCAIPQLDPLKFHEERSFRVHSATSTVIHLLISNSLLPVPLSGLESAEASLGISAIRSLIAVAVRECFSAYAFKMCSLPVRTSAASRSSGGKTSVKVRPARYRTRYRTRYRYI